MTEDRTSSYDFTLGELTLMQLALLETVSEIQEWEFSIRLAWSREDAIGTIAKLETQVRELQSLRDNERSEHRSVQLSEKDVDLIFRALVEVRFGFVSARFDAAADSADIDLDDLMSTLRPSHLRKLRSWPKEWHP